MWDFINSEWERSGLEQGEDSWAEDPGMTALIAGWWPVQIEKLLEWSPLTAMREWERKGHPTARFGPERCESWGSLPSLLEWEDHGSHSQTPLVLSGLCRGHTAVPMALPPANFLSLARSWSPLWQMYTFLGKIKSEIGWKVKESWSNKLLADCVKWHFFFLLTWKLKNLLRDN